jgi:hypothetical protein
MALAIYAQERIGIVSERTEEIDVDQIMARLELDRHF